MVQAARQAIVHLRTPGEQWQLHQPGAILQWHLSLLVRLHCSSVLPGHVAMGHTEKVRLRSLLLVCVVGSFDAAVVVAAAALLLVVATVAVLVVVAVVVVVMFDILLLVGVSDPTRQWWLRNHCWKCIGQRRCIPNFSIGSFQFPHPVQLRIGCLWVQRRFSCCHQFRVLCHLPFPFP